MAKNQFCVFNTGCRNTHTHTGSYVKTILSSHYSGKQTDTPDSVLFPCL